jgi:hypothetical protein
MYEGKTLVIILCMHRCGSSVTTDILQRLGMSLGPFPLMGANEYNEYGYFEAMPFYELDRELQSQELGFAWDIPESPDVLRRFCQREGRWQSDTSIPESTIQRGKELVEQLTGSGAISGFKDPRTALLWPLWSRVLSCFPGLRIVPLFLLRSPHEIGMSIFRRSKGAFAYQDALDVTAVHLKRMRSILENWVGDHTIVRFDPMVYAEDMRRAVQTCGLTWHEEAFAEVYDATSKHYEPAVVTHEAQSLFETLGGVKANGYCAGNLACLERDATAREDIMRAEIKQHQRQSEQCRQEAAHYQQQNEQYRQEIGQRRQEAQLYRQEIEQRRQEAQLHRQEIEQRRQEAQLHRQEIEQRRQEAQLYRQEIGQRRQEAQLHRQEIEQRRREAQLYRQEIEQRRQEAQQYRREIERRWQEAERHRREIEALQYVQSQLESGLALIRGSRTWRLREHVVSTLRFLRRAG